MIAKTTHVKITPQRQPNQYSCTATSLSMAMQSLGIPAFECSVKHVNKVLGAVPLQGGSWDQVAGAASHFGCRVTLVIPATLNMVRQWTDQGIPVLIGWNTGAEWSHASLIFSVTDTDVSIADPNIKNPDRLIRVLSHDDFYEKWWEKASQGYLIRRPAMAVEREISQDGRQMVASRRILTGAGLSQPIRGQTEHMTMLDEVADFGVEAKRPQPVNPRKRKDNKVRGPGNKIRNPVTRGLIEKGPSGGRHQNRPYDEAKGRQRRQKHPKPWERDAALSQPLSLRSDYGTGDTLGRRLEEEAERTATYDGNPDGVPIYPNDIDHGVDAPLTGGFNVMQQLQNDLLHEQGNDEMKRRLARRYLSGRME